LLLELYTLKSGGKRDRTDDLLLAKQALSQLSYAPETNFMFLASNSPVLPSKLESRLGQIRTADLVLIRDAL
jgi:hypothetical protein